MKKTLKVNAEKCTGCRYCEMVCSLKHEGLINRKKSGIRVLKLGIREDVPILCGQGTNCNYECIDVCPKNAISIQNEVVTVDREKCIGCGLCVEACPNKEIWIVNGLVYKCDMCGGDPECVKFCTVGALYFD